MKWILYPLIAIGLWVGFHHWPAIVGGPRIIGPVSSASQKKLPPNKIRSAATALVPTDPSKKEKGEGAATVADDDLAASQAVRDMLDDTEYMKSKWQKFRDSVYQGQLKLSDTDLARIQALRNVYQKKFNELASRLDAGSEEQQDQVVKEFVQQSTAFNEGIRKIVGNEKFAALEEWKNYFNQEIRTQVRTGVEVNSFW